MAEIPSQAKQQYVASMFARIAGRYDLMNDLMTLGLHRRWKRRAAEFTAKGLQGNALDVATGTGDLAFALARCPGIEQAVGVDLLPAMLALGRAKSKGAGLTAAITLLPGDAVNLPFADGSFACATAGFSLRNMPDLGQALSEMVRVVKPGGRITTLELTPVPDRGRFRLFRWYFHGLVPLMGQIVAGDRSAYTYLPRSVDEFLPAERLAALFRELGLVDVGFRFFGFGAVTLHWGSRPGGSSRQA